MATLHARAKERSAVLATRALQWLARRLGPRFAIALALLLSAAAVIDAYVQPFMRGLETRSFDLILRNRLLAAGPDPDIVIIDIDEASLAAMSEEHGRWPWPRAVLAEVLEAVEAQGARAVFFDVLFADPDTHNPDSEQVFNDVVAASQRSYFAMLRLDRARDARSELHASQVPGAVRDPGAPEDALETDDPTVAMILPRFPAILDSGRVGTVDARPDRDGVLRRFALYERAGAWRIPSLPLVLGRGVGIDMPQEPSILLNWRGGPFAYRYVPFAEVHADALRRDKRRDPREFAGKIVLIGSTAPALFDLRATPMAAVHPGVEILATAIDNLRHGDYYRSLGKPVSLAVSLALIWSLALALRRLSRGSETGPVMLLLQLALLAVAYVSLNVTHYYVDLVVPFSFGFAFFLVWSLRADLRERAAQLGNAVSLALERGRRYRVLLLIARPSQAGTAGRMRAWLIDRVCASRARARLADPPYHGRGVLGSDFAGLAIVYWLVPEDDAALARAAAAERHAFAEAILRREGAGAALATEESAFEYSGERSGEVGRMLLDALGKLRRPDAGPETAHH